MATFALFFALLMINGFIMFNYLVYIHIEGRVIDIFTRVTGDVGHFFVPFDNEVSARYLQWIISRLKKENASIRGTLTGTKHAAVTYHFVENIHQGIKVKITHILTYKRSKL